MSRRRVLVDEGWYHVMNRGHSRRYVFLNDEMYQFFIHLLDIISDRYCVEIHAFCLMGNHYHLLIHDPQNNLSLAMRYLNSQYAKFFNKSRGREGALFKGRFKSIVIETDLALTNVFRYIHLNPVEGGLVENPLDYMWSSASSFLKKDNSDWPFIQKDIFSNMIQDIPQYLSNGVPRKILEFYDKAYLKYRLK